MTELFNPISAHIDLTGLESDDHTQYLLASGTRALTGNWTAGNFQIDQGAAAQNAQHNLLVTSTSKPGTWYKAGATVNEILWTSGQSYNGFGWRLRQDESVSGDTFLERNNSGVSGAFVTALRYKRTGGGLRIGSSDTVTQSGSLECEGLIWAQDGVHFNKSQQGGAASNLVFSSVARVYLLYCSGAEDGVAIGGTAVNGGNLTYAAGQTSTNKSGTNITTSAVTDNLIQWQGAGNYHSANANVYGWGWKQEEVTAGDFWLFNKNGGAADDAVVQYWKRSNGFVGIGTWSVATPPTFRLDVSGGFRVSSSATIAGGLDHDGTTVGFYGITPVVRPSVYTQTYSTTTRTHSNPLASATTGTSTQTSPWGYGNQATADNLITAISNLVTDVANVKQVLNQVLDDFQLNGLLQ